MRWDTASFFIQWWDRVADKPVPARRLVDLVERLLADPAQGLDAASDRSAG